MTNEEILRKKAPLAHGNIELFKQVRSAMQQARTDAVQEYKEWRKLNEARELKTITEIRLKYKRDTDHYADTEYTDDDIENIALEYHNQFKKGYSVDEIVNIISERTVLDGESFRAYFSTLQPREDKSEENYGTPNQQSDYFKQ